MCHVEYIILGALCLNCTVDIPLRKHAYSNSLRILPPKKNENFQITNSGSFHISAENIYSGYLLELPSKECPQSMFLSTNKKLMYTPCKPQFYCTKQGFNGVKSIDACFRDVYQYHM